MPDPAFTQVVKTTKKEIKRLCLDAELRGCKVKRQILGVTDNICIDGILTAYVKPKGAYVIIQVGTMHKPDLPDGQRFVTNEEKDSVRHLSGYLAVYPVILNKASRWDWGRGKWKPGPFRYFWDDQFYCVPSEIPNNATGEKS